MKALLESADGLQKWMIVPDGIKKITTALLPSTLAYGLEPAETLVADIHGRHYGFVEMRHWNNEPYGYFREELD